MAFGFVMKIIRLDKFPTLVTLLSSIVAFSLSLIVLVSSGSKGQLYKYDMMMLNTSTLFQNAIKVESVATTTTAKRVMPRATPPPSLEHIVSLGRLEDRAPDLLSDVSTFFAGLSPTATSGLVASATAIIGGALGDLGTLAGQEAENVINGLVEEVMSALGIQQYYTLYMMEFCEGNFVPTYSDPKAVMNVTNCTKYSDVSIPTTNSTVTIGQTRFDFSAVNLPNKLSSAGGQLTTILSLIFALQLIGVISTGLLILICPLSLVLSIFNGRLARFAIAGLATLAAISLSIDAGVLTAVPIVAGKLVNQLAGDLGAQAHPGGNFITMVIVSSVFMDLSSLIWFVQWFDRRFARRSEGDKITNVRDPTTKSKTAGPVIVKTPRDAYRQSQETGTVRSL